MTPFVNVLWSSAVEAFPSVEGAATSAENDATTTHVVTLPGGVTSGDLLLIFIRNMGDTPVYTTPTGWTLVGSIATNGVSYVYKRVADGGEGATVSITADSTGRSASIAARISGAHGDVEAEMTDGSLDAPSITPSWGAAKTLLIAYGSSRRVVNTLTAPSPFTGQVDSATDDTGSTLDGRVAIAFHDSEAASYNPDAWGSSGTVNRPQSGIVAVRPA